MNEGKKTAIFAVVAITSLLAAFITRPQSATTEKDQLREMVNKAVFESKFTDPDKAASLEITTYDETLGTLKSFEVAKDKTTKLWKIPSHDDYPADAAEQVRDATTPLTDLKILAVVTSDRSEHGYYGVVEPNSEKLNVGDKGVGMMVTVKGDDGTVVASLVIGKQDAKNESQRYVRVPSQDPVYLVELSTTPFTTDFKKWIKGELLGVNSFDINAVSIRDYAITVQPQGAFISHTYNADCEYDTTASKWNLKKLVDYVQDKPVEATLAADDELKSDKLNDLRSSVQSLVIADVMRKPKGLAADLKADKTLLDNRESLMSLQSQGFFALPGPDNSTDILSSSGETAITTTEGVRYALRFGETLVRLQNNDAKKAEGSETGLQRYLLVTTTVDESRFPQPELQKVPETVEEMLKLEAAANPEAVGAQSSIPAAPVDVPAAQNNSPTPAVENKDNAGTEKTSDPTKSETAVDKSPSEEANKSPDAKPETQPKTEPSESNSTQDAQKSKEPTATDSSEAKSDAPKDGGCGEPDPQEPVNATAGAETPAASGQEPKAGDEAKSDANQSDANTDSASQNTAKPDTDGKPPEPAGKPAETKPAADSKPAEVASPPKPQATEEELKERLQATKERITKENQRKIDERNEKLEKAKKKVLELNARFSEWYYVVDDSMFKKLKLTRSELVGKKTATDAPAPTFPGANPLGGLPGGSL